MLIEASRQQVKYRRRTHFRRLRLQQPKHWSSMKPWRNLMLPWPSFTLGMTGTGPARKGKQNVPSNSIQIGVLATSLTRNCSASPGRSEEAIAEGARALELDPLSLIINALNGYHL